MSSHVTNEEPLQSRGRRRSLRYMYVKEWILQQVESGHLAPGSRLPSELELAQTLGVSLVTVRTALTELQGEGVIGRQQGRGTFVLSHGFFLSSRLEDLVSLTDLITDAGYQATVTDLKISEEPCSAANATWFQIPVGAPLVHVQRVYMADGQPAVLVADQIPASWLKSLPNPTTFNGDMIRFLETESIYPLDHVFALIKAVPARHDVAVALGVSIGSPVLMIEHRGYSLDERPVLASQGFNRSDLVAYSVLRKRRRIDVEPMW